METKPVSVEMIAAAIQHMDENTSRIEKCLLLLSGPDVWKRLNPTTNSIGNLILHLCGNITQYILSSLGGAPDNRTRDEEFKAFGTLNKDQLIEELYNTVAKATHIINTISDGELLRKRMVQGFNLTGIEIIIHVVEHYSYHTGQIALITKLVKGVDLGFYAGMDLNQTNL